MAIANRLITISPGELDAWLDRARAERWSQLAIVGPAVRLSESVEGWPRSLKAVDRVIRVSAWVAFPTDRLRSLNVLTALVLLQYITD